MFKDAEFMSAKEKEKAWKNFKKIIDKRDISILKKPLYQHLHLHCGFIAHYSIDGFKAVYSGQGFRRFIEHFDKNHHYNSPQYLNFCWLDHGDYYDINKMMVDYVTERASQIYAELDHAQNEIEIKMMYALAKKHGYMDKLPARPPRAKQVSIFDVAL